ncbi:MAG: hypothetical protein OM95_00885 [Bdellovibrio sp. ArHS]|uniref:KH domain-containing protein n=1 Tax=Bdellovibrio sp. ArHS TaxID=1569284 RepID=UPI000583210B|nr:KH domain-containing protein [Bdellovibrio sp. ArHS]KHD89667.1 MAG: hypothetical protein OM95_00885 [Bdellovibrio sp. ArHS]
MSEVKPHIVRRTKTIDEVPKSFQGNLPKEQVVEDLKNRIEGLLKMIVEDSNDVGISVVQGERTTVFAVSCQRHNIARILGRKGKTIDAIRTLVTSVTGRYGFRAVVEVPYFEEVKISE